MRKLIVVSTVLLIGAFGIAARTTKPQDASAQQAKKTDYKAFQHKLSKDDQILQAINRLTFGPQPGEIEQVRKMGLKKWIDLELHPERITENPELAARLEPLESLRLSQAEAARNYPNPQMIRAIAMGREPMPEDPVTRAAVERLIRRVKVAQKVDAKKGDGAAAAIADSGPLEAAVPLDDLLTRDQIRTLRQGTLEQKRAILTAFPQDKIDDLAIALPQGLRFQLLPAATPELRRKLMLMSAPQQLIAYDLSEGKLYRAILSDRQLEEELVDFWYNHFNVFLDKGSDRFLVPTYEREAIRPHVLGRFRDLLEATAQSPAMLFYLDNWESVGPDTQRRPANAKRPARGLNENYGRELLELHTLGVDGGYTQKDVTEVARCFTGWTIRAPREGGGFFYNDRVHDKGEKIVLGVKIPAGGGKDDGERVLDILARHPSTARFISRKLAERFVADDPPPQLIEKMAKTFRDSNGDIRAVMKTMLASNEFFSEGAFRAKMKTPFEMVVSAVRATGAQVDFAFPLANQLNQFGQPLYRKLEPTGYSNVSSEWINSASLLARMNFALSLTQNKVNGIRIDASRFDEDPAKAARQLLYRDPSPQTLASIQKALDQMNSQTIPQTGPPQTSGIMQQKNSADLPKGNSQGLIAGLLLGSPEFQKR